eukprot:CAMPEP_0196587866 /NCGR_PEP_ID=MMETSP1081-20130531/58856_1 /TAXON_ID=36882 /ORGANISM="Pyramimonas amylifera, Strain CCMP720" /LENGTH=250 /DNA_ID=CAMNT_0041910185 /DNA_START=177 /DNA_END=932 /DNA_ORIENTATION=-
MTQSAGASHSLTDQKSSSFSSSPTRPTGRPPRILTPLLGSVGLPKPRLRGVVFDMDGTLTIPSHDFEEMRRRVGVPSGSDILEVIASWSPEEQARANAILKEIDEESGRKIALMPGVNELCSFLDSLGIVRGILTRNVSMSVDILHANHLTVPPFLPAMTREDPPFKPHPQSLLRICQGWNLPPDQCIMIGDSAKDDIVVGNRVGTSTILLDTEGLYSDHDLMKEMRPNFVISRFEDICPLLESHFSFDD